MGTNGSFATTMPAKLGTRHEHVSTEGAGKNKRQQAGLVVARYSQKKRSGADGQQSYGWNLSRKKMRTDEGVDQSTPKTGAWNIARTKEG